VHTVSTPLLFVLFLSAVATGLEARQVRQDVPCATCAAVIVQPPDVERLPPALNGLEIILPLAAETDAGALLGPIRGIRARGGRPGALIEAVGAARLPPSVAELLDTVILRSRGAAGAVAAFDLKSGLTGLRAAVRRDTPIGLAVPAVVLDDLLERGIAPYLDFVVSRASPGHVLPWWMEQGELTDATDAMRGKGVRSIWIAASDAQTRERALVDLAAAARLLTPQLVPAADADVSCAGRGADVWLDPATLARVAWVAGCPRDQLRIGPGSAPADIVTLSGGDLMIRLAEPSPYRFAHGVDVRAPRALTIREIIARHQAAAERQRARVRTRISTGTMTLTFEAPGFAAPLSIRSDTVVYSDRTRTDVEQRAIRINGLEFAAGDVPRLPLLEPERVASMPLAIELTDAYEYALDGLDRVDGVRCYAVRFQPLPGDDTMFRGKAWIAADSFGLVKVAATQVRLRGPIVSSEQVDEFTRVEPDLWLLRRSRIDQVYEGPAHRTPIERVLTIDRHDVNPADFVERRAAAYASDHVMVRDTPEGYRYLQRSGAAARDARVGATDRSVVERSATQVRTLALGAIVDPNITHPLPFAGFGYVDFDLLGTGTQFSGFFGGTFAQFAFSVPSVGGTRWQLAGRGFAIATAFNDRAFVGGREQYAENIRQRPAHGSVWWLHPVTSRLTVRLGYDLDYVHYRRADTTRDDFAVPAAQVVHAFRVALEGQRRGWNGSLWWSPAVRQGWRAWGTPGTGDFMPAHGGFQRYGVSVARTATLSPASVVRAEAVWMGGHDLDRFSRYAFGAFENRLRGYPGGLIRYDRGAVLRGAAAWSVGPRIRLDAFVDSAYVHDPGFGDGLRPFTGLGAALEAPAPFGMLLAAEWGVGIQGRRSDGGRGTQVFRLTAYKMF
jgi:hypothetical protein